MTERESYVHTQEKLHARMVPLLFTNKYRLVKSCFVSVLGKVNVGDRQCHLLHTIMLIQSVRIISNTNCQPNIEELLLLQLLGYISLVLLLLLTLFLLLLLLRPPLL